MAIILINNNVDMFSSNDFLSSNNPDLNFVDYYVWSGIERVSNIFRNPFLR